MLSRWDFAGGEFAPRAGQHAKDVARSDNVTRSRVDPLRSEPGRIYAGKRARDYQLLPSMQRHACGSGPSGINKDQDGIRGKEEKREERNGEHVSGGHAYMCMQDDNCYYCT